ncbi:MAG TPA: hypothetical protein VGO47_11060, partial [Chlamydiales bacterium]|nr:hypothetical protein [Chlamydiales bacterium]
MQNDNFSIWRVLSNAYRNASQWVMENNATNVAIGPIAWVGTTAALARGEVLPSWREIHVLQPSEKEVQEVRALPTQRKIPDLEERDIAPVVSVASDIACCTHPTLPSGPSHKFLTLGPRQSPGIEIVGEGGCIEAIQPPSPTTQSRELSRGSKCQEFMGKTTRLEMQFMEEITSFGAEDIERRPGNWPTQGYLLPNEENVLEVQPHLVMKKPGKLVCTGAERSLFNLILADPTKCEGLVVVDFDPLTKA